MKAPHDRTLWRLLAFLRPHAGWVLLSVQLGVLTIASSVALMGVSAYLISMAALQPSIAVLQTSIVGVRFFGITRGVFRYPSPPPRCPKAAALASFPACGSQLTVCCQPQMKVGP